MSGFKLSKNFIEQYKNIEPPFGFNGLGELVYMRTYSRTKEDGKNEKWFETCQRVVEGTYNMQKEHIEANGLGWNAWTAQNSAKEMYDRLFNLKWTAPGRGLWAMGSPIIEERKLYASLNNCAFHGTAKMKEDPAKPFTFLMDASMLGVGVGFDTKGAGSVVIKGPNPNRTVEKYIIPDSREGWVESVKMLLESYFLGMANVEFDYSFIRLDGAAIKGFGGISSGPDPLKQLHEGIREVLNKEIGNSISTTTIVDLQNLIGKAVVSGNVRRTAEIVFGDPYSSEYLDLKDYEKNPQRADFGWTSNNSIFANLGMDYSNVCERTKENGEPGFAWLENMQGYSRMDNGADFKDKRVSGGNPCVVGSTLIAVADGRNAVPIKDLVGTCYPVYTIKNKKVTIGKSVKTWKTKENTEIWKIILDDYSEILLTPDHEIMLRNGEYKEVKDLKENDSLMPFNSYVSNKRYRQISSNTGRDRRQYRLIAEYNNLIVNPKKEAIHHIDFNSLNDCIDNLKSMLHEDHRKLHRDKMIGKNNPMKNPDVVKKMKKTSDALEILDIMNGDDEELRQMVAAEREKLLIGSKSLKNWEKQKDFMSESIKKGMESAEVREKISKSKRKTSENHKIKSVSFHGFEDVYDMEVEETNNFGIITSFEDPKFIASSGIFIHNCLEQSLESAELCCLVESFPNNHADLEDYKKTLKYAYLYAKTVTLGKTHWPETNRVMLRNRRIGCSVSGVAQFIAKRGIHELKRWLTEGYNYIRELDETYSEWLAIPKSIKTTSVKPSGTVSLLAGATPGIHYPESRFYIRRIRLAKNSALIKPLLKAGYNIEPCVGSEETTVVIEFPIDIGEGVRTKKEVSMWEQLCLAAFMQRYWADNQVSATITFNPETEGDQIKYALNYFQYQLKGVSFLPLKENVYAQMPYEAISEEKYLDLVKNLKKIDFSKTKNEITELDVFCNNDVCELVPKN